MPFYRSEAIDLSLPLKLHLLKHDGFNKVIKRHVNIDFSTTQYTVKTIDTYDEYLQVMHLRHLVFQKEFAGKKFCLRSDRDKYDSRADFLVVKNNLSNSIVGCYRLLCSEYTQDFYSASEFDISSLLASEGVKVELSRACILKEHRNGRVINLLWKGIGLYMQQVNARYFFGCGSVQTMDPIKLMAMEAHFEAEGIRSKRFPTTVQKKYKMQAPRRDDVELSCPHTMDVPSLLRAYFKAGARVCSAPAIDREFKCADFLIVLDTEEVNQHHKERYAHTQAIS